MRYRGYINNTCFFDTASHYDGYDVTSAEVSLELGASGSAVFGIPPANIFYGNFNKLADAVSVYRDDEEIFNGRVYGVSGELNTVHTVTCEGYLAVLNDSIFEPDTYECSLAELVSAIINNHNSKCPSWPLTVGTLEFEDSYVYRAYENYESSKSRLDDLVDSYGGYLVCRHEADAVYLDWLDLDNTADEGQAINFGENLLDIVQESTADEIITALIPIGATVTEEAEDEDEEDTEYTVDISSVNDGLIYIYDADAVEEYGWIWGTYTWDDVEEPANLYTKAVAYLTEKCKSYVTIEVSAVDLAEAGYDYEAFSIGVKNPVVSSPHGIDDSYLCTALDINCLDRTSSTMTLGGERVGIVSTSNKNYQSNVRLIEKITANYATNNALSSVAEKVKTNTSLITQLSDLIGLYVSEDTTVGSTVIESLTSSIELTAEEILATVSATYATSDDVSAMIRLTTDGVEVARIEDGAYTSTKTLITDEGMSIVSSDDSTTYMEVLSDAINLYGGGLIGQAITASGTTIYADGHASTIVASGTTTIGADTGAPLYISAYSDGVAQIAGGASSSTATIQIGESDSDNALMLLTCNQSGASGYPYVTITADGTSSQCALGTSTGGDAHVTAIGDAEGGSAYVRIGGDELYVLCDAAFSGDLSAMGGSAYLSKTVYMGAAKARVRYVDCGTVTVECAANEVTEADVTFNVEFSSAPYVVATAHSEYPYTRVCEVTVANRTTTGCEVYMYRTTAVDTMVSWIAAGYLAS